MKEISKSKSRRAVIAAVISLVLVMTSVMIIRKNKIPDYTGVEYEVSSLDMRIAAGKDRTYEVEEFISVDIPEALPAIAFAIPGDSLELKDLTVEDEETRPVKGVPGRYAVIRDPQLLTEGHHRYRITYRLRDRADTDTDVFSFNVLPEGWEQPVYKLHALMWFPYGFPLDDIRVYADESRVSRLTIKKEPQSRSFTIGIRGIPEDYSVRLEADLPDGFYEQDQ